jgi:ribosome biogenesis GTPase / thiamine phosphate phosphatase
VTAEGVPARERAVVARVDFNACALLMDDGTLAEATVRGTLRGHNKALGNAVVVGDRVECESWNGRLVITGVEPRRNTFSRRAAGNAPREQVVAANVDQVMLVASIDDPPFKAGLADRVLGQAHHGGLAAHLVLNKADLDRGGEAEAIARDYAAAGYPGHITSAHSGRGVEGLRETCRGHRSLFVGHSGVGKSRLLSALVPKLDLLSGLVNPKTGKGRHTTTAAWLLRPEPGFEVIDTPGVRAFGLWGIGSDDLDRAYPEFADVLGRCRFSDCRHLEEPGCAVRAAVERGAIARRRYQSFIKLREELQGEESPW